MQRLDEATYRIWFFHVPLGDWRPGIDSTAQALADSATRAEPIPRFALICPLDHAEPPG